MCVVLYSTSIYAWRFSKSVMAKLQVTQRSSAKSSFIPLMRSLEDRNKAAETLDLSQETPCSSYKPNKCLSVFRDRACKWGYFPRASPWIVTYLVAYSFRGKKSQIFPNLKRRKVFHAATSSVPILVFSAPFWIPLVAPFLPCWGCACQSLGPTRLLGRTRKCNYSHSLCFHYVCVNRLPFSNNLCWQQTIIIWCTYTAYKLKLIHYDAA